MIQNLLLLASIVNAQMCGEAFCERMQAASDVEYWLDNSTLYVNETCSDMFGTLELQSSDAAVEQAETLKISFLFYARGILRIKLTDPHTERFSISDEGLPVDIS